MKKIIAFVIMLAFLGLSIFLCAPSASALTVDDDDKTLTERYQEQMPDSVCDYIIGAALCDKWTDATTPNPPPVQVPGQGTAGIFLKAPEPPFQQGDPFDPTSGVTIYESSGTAGFKNYIFDVGTLDEEKLREPAASAVQAAGAWATTSASNDLVEIAISLTAFSSAVSEMALDPTWVNDILGNFATKVSNVVQVQIWGLAIAVAMLLTAIIIAWKHASQGDIPAVARGVAWTFAILAVGVVIAAYPLKAATLLQSGTAVVGSALGNTTQLPVPYSNTASVALPPGSVLLDPKKATIPAWAMPASATDAATSAIVRSVHYQGWERRTFGSENADVAAEYGPALFAAGRMTWQEMEDTKNDDTKLQALLKKKNADYLAVADNIRQKEPQAYDDIQGVVDRTGSGVVELIFSLLVNGIRILAYLLIMFCMIGLVFVSLMFIAALPWLITPAGEPMAKAFLGSAIRFAKFGLAAVFLSWLYALYCSVIFGPGLSTPASLIFLLLGTFFFWAILRPERKFLSLLPIGKMAPAGKYGMAAWTALGSFLGTRLGQRDAHEREEESTDREPAPYLLTFDRPVPVERERLAIGDVTYEGTIVDGQTVEPTRELPAGAPEPIRGESSWADDGDFFTRPDDDDAADQQADVAPSTPAIEPARADEESNR